MGYQFIIKKFIQKPELGLNVNFTRLTSGSKDMSIALAEQSSRAMRKADLGTTAYQSFHMPKLRLIIYLDI